MNLKEKNLNVKKANIKLSDGKNFKKSIKDVQKKLDDFEFLEYI